MSWPRPVRATLSAAEGVLDRVLCVLGAVLFSQAPEFMQQYLQRLGGHLDEARRQLDEYQTAATQSGQTLAQLIQHAGASPDPGVSRLAGVIAGTQTRVAQLAADEQAIRAAHALARPFVFVRHADAAIARATWQHFRPAVPTTLEGLFYALLGLFLLVSLYHGAVKLPIRRAWRRRRPVRPALPALALIVLGLGVAAPAARAQPRISEAEVKALFLFHFTQFVQWPASAFSSPRAPLVLGVANDPDFAKMLQRVVAGESMGTHPLEVREVKAARDVPGCQILYLPSRADALLGELPESRAILTVGETDRFARDGGIIRFFNDRNRLKLRINVRAARQDSIAISSKLLQLAQTEGAP